MFQRLLKLFKESSFQKSLRMKIFFSLILTSVCLIKSANATCDWLVGEYTCRENSTGNIRNLTILDASENTEGAPPKNDTWKMVLFDDVVPDKNGEEWETHILSDKYRYVPEAMSYEIAACQPIGGWPKPPAPPAPNPPPTPNPPASPAPSPVSSPATNPPTEPKPETNELKIVRRALSDRFPDFSEKIIRKRDAKIIDISIAAFNKTQKMFSDSLVCQRK